MQQLNPEDYKGQPIGICQGQPFQSWPRMGFLSLDVLPFLVGRKWDTVSLAYVHSLRPSSLRVVTDGIQLDARPWRVTVWIDENDFIKKIQQEVKVGLPDECNSGSALKDALKYGIDSEQVKWHEVDGMTCYGFGETSKITNDGKEIPYPQ